MSIIYHILKTPFYTGTFEYPRNSGIGIQGNILLLISKKVFDLKVEKKISDDDFTNYKNKFEIELTELNNSLIALTPPELEIENILDSGIEFLKHLPENWKSLEVKDFRVLRNLLFPQNLEYTYPGIQTV